MAVTNSVSLTFEYSDATTRTMTFDSVSSDALDSVKLRVVELNEAIADTVTGVAYKETFISDNGYPVVKISKAKYATTEESVIYSG